MTLAGSMRQTASIAAWVSDKFGEFAQPWPVVVFSRSAFTCAAIAADAIGTGRMNGSSAATIAGSRSYSATGVISVQSSPHTLSMHVSGIASAIARTIAGSSRS